MVLYLSVIVVALLLIISFDTFIATKIFEVGASVLNIAIIETFLLVIVINFVVPLIVVNLPKKWFNIDNKFFTVGARERKFFDVIRVRNWKDKVWELGGMGGFSKSHISDPHDPKYIERFIVESHKGILDHFLRIFLGFLIILLYPKYVWVVGFPIAMINVILNTMSLIVVRYNLPKLKIMHTRLLREQARAQENIESPNN